LDCPGTFAEDDVRLPHALFLHPFWEFFRNRAQRLYLPAIIIGLSCAIPSYFAGHTDTLEKLFTQIAGVVYSVPKSEYTFNATPIWFLSCLLCVEVYYWLICRHFKCDRWIPALVLLSAGLLVTQLTSYYFPLNCQYALVAVTFFHMGVKLRNIRFVEMHETRWYFFAISLIVLIVVTYLNPIKVGFAAGRFGDLNLLFLGTISGSYALFYVASKITISTPISMLGTNTILILGYNYWAYDLMSRLCTYYGFHLWYVNFAGQLLLFYFLSQVLSVLPRINCLLQGAPMPLKMNPVVGIADSRKRVSSTLPPHV
jgi:fucose 4-O-acetylase-like acetyltransferase